MLRVWPAERRRGGAAVSPINSKRKGSAFERELALELGGKRTPLSGSAGGGDITLPAESVWIAWAWEAKRRAELPRFLTGVLEQAASDIAIGDPRKPAAAFRADHGRTIVAFYLDDLRPWVEAIAELGAGARIRTIARDLDRIAAELRRATR